MRVANDIIGAMQKNPTLSDDKGTAHMNVCPERVQFVVAIQCHWCGHTGLSLWEEGKNGRELLTLEGFYERIASKRPHNIETVCDNCHQAQ